MSWSSQSQLPLSNLTGTSSPKNVPDYEKIQHVIPPDNVNARQYDMEMTTPRISTRKDNQKENRKSWHGNLSDNYANITTGSSEVVSRHAPDGDLYDPNAYQPTKYGLVSHTHEPYRHSPSPPTVIVKRTTTHDAYQTVSVSGGRSGIYESPPLPSRDYKSSSGTYSDFKTPKKQRVTQPPSTAASDYYGVDRGNTKYHQSSYSIKHERTNTSPPFVPPHSQSADLTNWQQQQQRRREHHSELQGIYNSKSTESSSLHIAFQEFSMNKDPDYPRAAGQSEYPRATGQSEYHRAPVSSEYPRAPVSSEYPRATVSSEYPRAPGQPDNGHFVQKQNLPDVIGKLKMKIIELEDKVKEYEGKLRRAVMAQENEGDTTHIRLQELEFQTSSLKSKLAETMATKQAQIDDLSVNLGAAEHEIIQLKAMLREKKIDDDKVSHERQAQLTEKVHLADEWHQKCIELMNHDREMRQNVESLERYMADLPTKEEAADRTQQIITMQEEIRSQKIRISELERKVHREKKSLTARSFQIKELEDKNIHLESEITNMSVEIRQLKSSKEGSALAKAQTELCKLREEKERLAIDLAKAKKLLEVTHGNVRHVEVKHLNEVKMMDERVCREEEAVATLREDIRTKERQVQKLAKALKDTASKNQDLLEKNLILQEQISDFERQCSDENQKLERQFVREMKICFTELQSLVHVCKQRAEGQDPNLSVLLGVSASGAEGDDVIGMDTQSLKYRLARLNELKADVDKLRAIISNQYAEDLGKNINCITQ